MCGITGYINPQNFSQNPYQILSDMTHALHHRGPDDVGKWYDERAGIGLGHRRLSILDLSPQGHQPMHSNCGRYVITYNGEIYNYRILKKTLENLGHSFRSRSDTEVLLTAISTWGIKKALSEFNGMFAFALWDKEKQSLYLARDRLGEKPLYYGHINNTFLFASELKALHKHPNFNAELDRDSLSLYLKYNYIPSPHSIYRNICKLPAASFLEISLTGNSIISSQPIYYWSAEQVAQAGMDNNLKLSDQEAIDRTHELLSESINLRMIADVPVGIFLSGGIDSSLITALMQINSTRPIKTFTIGFNQKSYNEAEYAKTIAKHLGTDHTELYVESDHALNVIPKLPGIFDEPFADSSQIPTFLLSELTRQHVTVALSGDGGDELFGGYNRYFIYKMIWNKIQLLPFAFRKLIAASISYLSPQKLNLLSKYITRYHLSYDRLQKLIFILTATNQPKIYDYLISQWQNPNEIVINAKEPLVDHSIGEHLQFNTFIEQMMHIDMVKYLPDDLLVKVDRASMAVSLETRAPFLDHHLVEYVWRLPLNFKIRKNESKWLLRQILEKYIPKNLIDRPKMGFGVPIDIWLRGPLRDWAESLLEETTLLQQGLFNPAPIKQKWQEHLSGKRNWQYHIWTILMFQVWLNNQKN